MCLRCYYSELRHVMLLKLIHTCMTIMYIPELKTIIIIKLIKIKQF